MRQLFAYLLVRLSDGSWEVGSHRGLETLVSAWKAVPDAKACGVVHVGFWRPDTAEFEEAASGRPGQVLLTEPARWALPESFRASAGSVGSAAGIPLYRGQSGWGFDVADEDAREAEGIPPDTDVRAPPVVPKTSAASVSVVEPWLEWVRSKRPEVWSEAAAGGIADDATYLSNEWLLPPAARDEIGGLRFRWFVRGEISESNILAHLASAPPWLLAVEVHYLMLSRRASNCLASEGLATIGDVARFGEAKLFKIPNMGRRSVAEIAQRILDCYRHGSAYCSRYAPARSDLSGDPAAPLQIQSPLFVPEAASSSDFPRVASDPLPESFSSGLRDALARCEDRDAKVLRLRMGLLGPIQTLDAVGTTLSVTRERVRQIEKKAVKHIATLFQPWIGRIGGGVAEALAGRDEPLPLVGLEILDPWFAGVGENGGPLRFAFEHFFEEQPFWLLKVDGQSFVSGVAPDEWREALRKARALLADIVGGDRSVSEADARCLSDSMLSEAAASLRPLFWSHATRWANFSTTPAGERRLVSFGQGAEGVVEAALMESDRPLHYEEIAKRCSARGKPIEVRRAHSAAASIGILMAPGVYGLERHFPLSEEEAASVVSEAEIVVLENPSKQWHGDEIAEELGDRGLDFGGRLNKYVLNHALKASNALVYLGRFVWALRSGGVRGKADRIGVWQAVAAMLEENSGPMRTEEIRDRLSRDRGLGATTLLIPQGDPLIRVGEGAWGLLWRDVPFSEAEAADVVREMEEVCRSRGEGLHVSEIVGALRSTAELASRAKDPVLLVSLAARTGRMKAARGGYVHPSDWEGARRLCANEAVAEALAEAGSSGWTLAALAARAGGLLGREIPTYVASRMLISAGAVYDEERAVWRVPETAAGDGEEDDPDASPGAEMENGSSASEAVSGSDWPPSGTSGASAPPTAHGV
jgi:hypothetical protein